MSDRGARVLRIVEALMPLLQDGTVKMLDVGPGTVHASLDRTVFYVRQQPVNFEEAVRKVIRNVELEREERRRLRHLMREGPRT